MILLLITVLAFPYKLYYHCGTLALWAHSVRLPSVLEWATQYTQQAQSRVALDEKITCLLLVLFIIFYYLFGS